MPLFQQSVIKKHIESFDAKHLEERWQLFRGIFHTAEKQQNIRNSKEEQYQEGFLRDLFVTVLGYTINPEVNFNLLTEQKNVNNSKKADGAVLLDGRAIAVIELKGTETTDLNKIEIQAFGYKNNQPGCNYVITSNFEKLRFYIDNTTQQEEFNLFTLTKAQFELLYACLAWESISKNTPMQILNESVSKENIITKSLYKDYSEFKRALFANLVEMNPQYDKLVLFKKTQKLLDRFLFIFFAEDRLLLPTNLIFRINKEWENIIAQRIQVSLYDRYKMYFNDLNVGAKVTLPAFGKKTGEAITAEFEIFAYNGGLFQPDDLLDNIQIEDTLLHSYTQKMSHYNFESDVDVNILGHIFENSLNEIDEIKSEIEGNVLEKTKTRRKKDGVFYTPKYITKYIVDNTIGKLCTEKKEEIKLLDEDYVSTSASRLSLDVLSKSGYSKTKKKALLDKLTDYRNWLLDLTICDPACGSGAFLNQALEFLIAEHRYVDELQAKLLGDSMILSDIENSILERNIYGVDLNDESVEIAKLSLWLRTAQKGRKLNSLNNNIKCGNSLIDDPAVAGDKAFSWEKEFPEVFAKGGFDVVIGNPPYVRAEFLPQIHSRFYDQNYQSAFKQYDLYVLFYELGIKKLNINGCLGYITPNKFLIAEYGKKIRELILENNQIRKIVDVSMMNIFPDASVYPAILVISKNLIIDNRIQILPVVKNPNQLEFDEPFVLSQSVFSSNQDYVINTNVASFELINKIEENSISLSQKFKISRGFRPPKESLLSDVKTVSTYPLLIGEALSKAFNCKWNGVFVKFVKSEIFESKPLESYLVPKILIRDIGLKFNAFFDDSEFLCLKTIYFIYGAKEDELKSLTSILNTKLLNFYFKEKFSGMHISGGYLRFRKQFLDVLPLKTVDGRQKEKLAELCELQQLKNKQLQKNTDSFLSYFKSSLKILKTSRIIEKWYELEFVVFIKELNKAIKGVKGTPLTKKDEFEWMDLFEENKKKAQELKAEIDKTDKEIDQMVYELYGLTEEEIRIVEGT